MLQIIEFRDGRKTDCTSKLPFFKELEREFIDLDITSIDFFTMDGEESAELFKVTAVPCVIALKNGIEVERINSRTSKKHFKELIERWN